MEAAWQVRRRADREDRLEGQQVTDVLSAGFPRSFKVRRQWTEAAAVFSVHWQTVSTSAPVK
jgi:hypothetical protein